MLNVVAIMGRMVKDPELKSTNSGKSVCSFRIANDSGYKNADGSSQTNWLDVTAWGKTAEFVAQRLAGTAAAAAVDFMPGGVSETAATIAAERFMYEQRRRVAVLVQRYAKFIAGLHRLSVLSI